MNDKERLEQFELILSETQDELTLVESEIDKYKAQGKTKTTTFQQLLTRKMSLNQLLGKFEAHGLLED